MEQLRLLVVAMVGRKRWIVPVDDKVGKDDERDVRESSPQPGRRLRGGEARGRNYTTSPRDERRLEGRNWKRRR